MLLLSQPVVRNEEVGRMRNRCSLVRACLSCVYFWLGASGSVHPRRALLPVQLKLHNARGVANAGDPQHRMRLAEGAAPCPC